VEPTHTLLQELDGPECEIVEEAGELRIIAVAGRDGFATVPQGWLTPIPGKDIKKIEVQPPVGWVGRDKDKDIWHHFKLGNFLIPGKVQPKSWADIQEFGPFETVFDPTK
jgi:hypothetical protein